MLANGVLPACLLLLGIVFGLCLLAELASGYTLTLWLVALFWVYMGAETVALLNAINRCVYWYQ